MAVKRVLSTLSPLLWLVVAIWCACHAASAQLKSVPSPIFFAEGLTQTADLEAYKRAGFNTVVIKLTWQAGDGGLVNANEVASQKEFALEAAKRGLQIIYALPAAPQGFERSLRVAEDSSVYQTVWTTWVSGAMEVLKDTPNLLGWRLPDDPRGLGIFDDTGFARWLEANYASVAILNRQWGTNYRARSDASLSDVAALTARWRGFQEQGQSLSVEAARERMRDPNFDSAQRLAFHPASLALAAYKWDSYRALLTFWVGVVRETGGQKLVFSGALPDYAQLLSQPLGIDIVSPNMAPSIAEGDVATHNPQAIEVARRGGKFDVLPIFTTSESAVLPKVALAALAPRWMETAHARGARGMGFDSWGAIKADIPLGAAISDGLTRLRALGTRGLWGQAPTATVAVVLSPLAEGVVVGGGGFGAPAARGLYGFGEGLVSGEPSNLVWSLRWGTAFGGVDFLSPDDLDRPLDFYSTILAPQLLSCPLEVGQSLGAYVVRGGVLVADLGLGAMQNGGQANTIPPQMAQLFGVPGTYDLRPMLFNLRGVIAHPLLPSWGRMIGMRPNVSLTTGEAPGGAAFGGPTGFSLVPPAGNIAALAPELPFPLPTQPQFLRSPLTVHRSGAGFAIFAPFRLWQFWRPGHAGWNEFHGDLLARGAALALPVGALVPLPVGVPDGQTLFPEVVNRPDSITFLNHDAPGNAPKLASVQTTGVGDWLWRGAISAFGTGDVALAGARPAPVAFANPYQSTTRSLALWAKIENGLTQTADMVPVGAQNTGGGPLSATVLKWDATGVDVRLWPNSTNVVEVAEEWQPALGPAGNVRVSLLARADGYNFAPGSRHRALVTDFSKPGKRGQFETSEKILVAGAGGELSIEARGAALRVQIVPHTGK